MYGSRTIIGPVSFELEAPFFLVIAGLNGSGKSTFLNAITGQVSFEGTAVVDSEKLPIRNTNKRAELMAYLPQHNTVNFDIKVIDLVVMGRARFNGFMDPFSKKDYEISECALKTCGISHLKDRDFSELSGGEKQLVWIAQLHVQESAINLLDEPTQHLDLLNKKRLISILNQMVLNGKSVILVTHDLYQLRKVQASFINFSQKIPQMESLSEEVIQKNIDFLENLEINH